MEILDLEVLAVQDLVDMVDILDIEVIPDMVETETFVAAKGQIKTQKFIVKIKILIIIKIV